MSAAEVAPAAVDSCKEPVHPHSDVVLMPDQGDPAPVSLDSGKVKIFVPYFHAPCVALSPICSSCSFGPADLIWGSTTRTCTTGTKKNLKMILLIDLVKVPVLSFVQNTDGGVSHFHFCLVVIMGKREGPMEFLVLLLNKYLVLFKNILER